MATKVYVYGELGLWSCKESHRSNFEDEINAFLGRAGHTIWDRDEHAGPYWNVDLLLYDDARVGDWIQRLAAFMRQWGVPQGPITFTIWPQTDGPIQCRRVVVADNKHEETVS